MRRRVAGGSGNFQQRIGFRRVIETEPETGVEQPAGGGIEIGIGDPTGFQRAGERVVINATAQVATRLDRTGSGFRGRGDDFVVGINVPDGAVIGNDVPGETPIFPQRSAACFRLNDSFSCCLLITHFRVI